MTMFHQIELLPIAYFTVLMCVIAANVAAKLCGSLLIDATSGTLFNRILSRRVNVSLTGDEIVFHLFDRQLVASLNTRILMQLMRDLARLLGPGILVPLQAETIVLQKTRIPEKYWSGCPP